MQANQFYTLQQLFHAVDEACGINRVNTRGNVVQEDTSHYEALFQANDDVNSDKAADLDEKTNKIQRNRPDVSDFNKLRSLVQRIAIVDPEDGKEEDHSRVRAGVYYLKNPNNRQRDRKIDHSQLPMQLLDWESEVKDVMMSSIDISTSSDLGVVEYDSDDQIHSKPRPQQPPLVQPVQDIVKNSLSNTFYAGILPFEIAPYSCFDPEYIDVYGAKDPLNVIIPLGQIKTVDTSGDTLDEADSSSATNAAASSQQPNQQSQGPATAMTTKADENRLKLFSRLSRTVAAAADAEVAAAAAGAPLSRQEIFYRQRKEKADRIRKINFWLDTTGNLLKTAKKQRGDSAFNDYIRTLVSVISHNIVASSNRNTKADLTELELKYFHRPRLIKERGLPFDIKIRPKAHKQYSSLSSKARNLDKQKQTLSLAHNDHQFILVEYSEEFPPLMTNYGMASLMVNYFRSSNESNKAEEKQHELEASRDISLSNMQKVLEANNFRLPRHVMLLWQLKNAKRSYEHDADIPRLRLGQTKVLNPGDESPFLGVIEEGEIQPALVNNLFRAPIFQHQVNPTDFLILRTKISKDSMEYVVREIPFIFVSGQTEPLRIAPKPSSRLTAVQEKQYELAVARYLSMNLSGVTMAEIEKHVLRYAAKEITAPHKAGYRQGLREVIRRIGEEVRGKFYLKQECNELEGEPNYNPDELMTTFTPEEVCLQEATNAAEYRLRQQFITNVDLPKIQAYLHHLHKVKQFYRQRIERAKSASFGQTNVDKLIAIFDKEIQRVDKKLSIARFISERLVFAPWNTTEAFVRSVIEKDNLGKIELQGVGDPSGRGEGYSFKRIIRMDNEAAPPPGSTKLVGTDKDLRKLKTQESINLVVKLGVSLKEATAMRRWDRISIIRGKESRLDLKISPRHRSQCCFHLE